MLARSYLGAGDLARPALRGRSGGGTTRAGAGHGSSPPCAASSASWGSRGNRRASSPSLRLNPAQSQAGFEGRGRAGRSFPARGFAHFAETFLIAQRVCVVMEAQTLLVEDSALGAYEGHLAEHYDQFTAGCDYETWLGAFEEALALEHGLRGRRLLAFACGTTSKASGRWPGAATRSRPAGLSPSPAWSFAREKAPPGSGLFVADMRELPPAPASSTLVTCLDRARSTTCSTAAGSKPRWSGGMAASTQPGVGCWPSEPEQPRHLPAAQMGRGSIGDSRRPHVHHLARHAERGSAARRGLHGHDLRIRQRGGRRPLEPLIPTTHWQRLPARGRRWSGRSSSRASSSSRPGASYPGRGWSTGPTGIATRNAMLPGEKRKVNPLVVQP